MLEGWVSVEGAEADYGVIFTGDRMEGSLAVDVDQTHKLREQSRGDQV